tara:strand:+ start:199 stop:600 length:402 start_codon:yes stop_codon:yes gene_type:complete
MDMYLLYFLIFIFGYITCKTFYFASASRKSILLLQTTQLIGLFILVRAIESFNYAMQYRIDVMKKNNASEQNIKAFKLRYNDEVNLFKRRSVEKIIDAHGGFFSQTIEFDDWKSAMIFLEKNRENIINFIAQE